MSDEYADNDGNVRCTAAAGMDGVAFGNGDPRGSCMMWNLKPKLCSLRPENPHRGGTHQGGESCWSHLAAVYRDASSRWTVRTPDSRGVIVGSIPTLPVQGWAPRFNIDNRDQARICAPRTFTIRRSDTGQPNPQTDVWVRTTTGQTVYQGKTDMNGAIEIVGFHEGDQVVASGAYTFYVPVNSSCGAL